LTLRESLIEVTAIQINKNQAVM